MTCAYCNGPIPPQRTGRPAKYCSDRCRQKAKGEGRKKPR